jgi:hypothetical protein
MATDKNTRHSYFSHYEKIFEKFNKNNNLIYFMTSNGDFGN